MRTQTNPDLSRPYNSVLITQITQETKTFINYYF